MEMHQESEKSIGERERECELNKMWLQIMKTWSHWMICADPIVNI